MPRPDFSQKEYPVGGAIDEDPATGWGIFPEVGKAHQAMFTLTDPLAIASPVAVRVTLEFQSQFAQHQIGRFRLAVTSTAQPKLADGLPAEVATVLSTSANERIDAQKSVLRKYYRERVSPEFAKLSGQLTALKKQREELEKERRNGHGHAGYGAASRVICAYPWGI